MRTRGGNASCCDGLSDAVHPHHNKAHLVSQYRKHILSCKRRWSTARGLVHYRKIVATYLWAKRELLSSRSTTANGSSQSHSEAI